MKRLVTHILFFCLMGTLVSAQCDFRCCEPIVLDGNVLAALSGTPVDEWFLFSKIGEEWVETPYQIDERDVDGSYFQPDDGLWDGNDELVFLPQMGGRSTLISDWIPVADSRLFPRLEIQVLDDVAQCTKTVYLYRSSSLDPANWNDLIEADPVLDRITADAYQVGFDSSVNVWNELRFAEGAGYSVDILDREKARIDLTILFLNFSLNEESAEPIQTDFVDGTVRVIRHVTSQITLVEPMETESERHFYPESFGAFEGELVPDPLVTLNSVRFSFDFASEAIGATVSDPNNNSLLVDGIMDAGVVNTLSPQQTQAYWTQMNWNGNALIWAGAFDGLASTNELYYHDALDGSTGDGTPDTGDMLSYGDTGLHFNGIVPGNHYVSAKMLIDVNGVLTGPMVQSYIQQPLETSLNSQMFADGWSELLAAWHTIPPDAVSFITVEDLVSYVTQSGW